MRPSLQSEIEKKKDDLILAGCLLFWPLLELPLPEYWAICPLLE